MAEYEELVEVLRECSKLGKRYGMAVIYMDKAADAIEELSKLADAIPHVCECCVGCELEKKNGGCDHAFVLSSKRAMQYLIEPRWIPVTERLPDVWSDVLVAVLKHRPRSYPVRTMAVDFITMTGEWAEMSCDWRNEVTHWMPLPEPPREETE